MYILKKCKNNDDNRNKNYYHEKVVPPIFVALWIAGLTFSIINPQLPLLNSNNACTSLLSSLVYIYIIFIIEVIVTFTDIHNVYRLYNAKGLLWKITRKIILPNILFTIVALIWYFYHQEIIYLVPFVLLSACIKFLEVWLANNGETVFVKQQKEMNVNQIYKPHKLS